MPSVRIVYCVPCGHLPRALELARDLLQHYGQRMNKEFSVTLDTSDGGTFDVYINDRLAYSRKAEGGRFPSTAEIITQIEKLHSASA